MEKTKYNKWKGKYTDCNMINFTLHMREYKLDKISMSYKNVVFASLTKQEYNIFDGWTKKEQLNYLNGYWNYYMSMMA